MLTVDADIWRKINQGTDLGQCREEVAIFEKVSKGKYWLTGWADNQGEDMHRCWSKRQPLEAEGVASV